MRFLGPGRVERTLLEGASVERDQQRAQGEATHEDGHENQAIVRSRVVSQIGHDAEAEREAGEYHDAILEPVRPT